MKIAFMGTPDFAVSCLEKLIESDHEVVGVFTQPDKKRGRGQTISATPVKLTAVKNAIPVFQPENLKSNDALNVIENLQPDLIVVVAYGKILPKSILDLPKFGCINVHASLLPEYRGAAPIQWAIIDGKKKTGVTTMYMDEGLDTGDILLKKEISIEEDETARELYDRLSKLGADLLLETLKKLASGNLIPEKQDEDKATYSKMLTKEMAEIDWTKKAADIHNSVRGLIPWPVARTSLDGGALKIYKTRLANDEVGFPGDIKSLEPFVVHCGANTCLEILELQFNSKKRMNSADFFRGYKVKEKKLK